MTLTWKDRPHSLHESIESAIASRDCLFFDARQFAEGGKLNLEFTVYAQRENCPGVCPSFRPSVRTSFA